jgi:chromosome segregation ATPase
MTLEVETIVAASLMMAVFSAVAAVGTSIVLGAGFERLRTGFEVIRKQTGFFSDAIHKLEEKVEVVDQQTNNFSKSISTLEAKVAGVGEQANIFSISMKDLEQKVEGVDEQAGAFDQAIGKLEKRMDLITSHEQLVSEKMERSANTDLISTGKAEALVSHAENLLTQVSSLADRLEERQREPAIQQEEHLTIPRNLTHYAFQGGSQEEEIRYH